MGEGWGGGEEQYYHLSDGAETCLAHPPLAPSIRPSAYSGQALPSREGNRGEVLRSREGN